MRKSMRVFGILLVAVWVLGATVSIATQNVQRPTRSTENWQTQSIWEREQVYSDRMGDAWFSQK
ncbi:hypothetical protein PKU16_09995 [Weissella cibaria]|uniref:hypothetical protein n=1 Tax=Weissella cibaria TaxID=137591 RepID=UPI0023075B20|nr:hypothetical protein [Weissella cibaria]WCE24742.1 hypothetical protein PKU16_09995 [Weissella cibaria]WCE26930.1 hypothetical protein PKU15_09995 [Weissella cibaria]